MVDPQLLQRLAGDQYMQEFGPGGGAQLPAEYDPNTALFLADDTSPIPINRQVLPPVSTVTDTSVGNALSGNTVDPALSWMSPEGVNMAQTHENTPTLPGQYPQSFYEPGGRFYGADSAYNTAFDSSEAAYLAQNPAMSPQLANKLFPQSNVGPIMSRTNELAPDFPRETPGGGGGFYAGDSPSTTDAVYNDPSKLSAPPTIQSMTNPLGADTSIDPNLGPVSNQLTLQQMTNPLGADTSPSLGPVQDFQPPIQQGPPAVYNPQAEALALADQYMQESAAKTKRLNPAQSYNPLQYNIGDPPVENIENTNVPPGNVLNQYVDPNTKGIGGLQSLVQQPAGGGMSAEDAAKYLADNQAKTQAKIQPEVATPTTTGEGKTGDSSVITQPVVDTKKETDKIMQAGEQSTKTSIDAGKPGAKTTTSGGGIGTQIGTSTPSGVTTSSIAPSGGVNVSGIYDSTDPGKGIVGTSDIGYTDPEKVDPQKKGRMARFGDLMTSPKMRMAMLQAAKALDPTGFGGTLAKDMEPIIAGQFQEQYMSDLLSGKDPGSDEMQKKYGGVLTSDQMSSARDDVIKIAEQNRKQQATDETEDPVQKFYRDMTGKALTGEYGLAVADKNYWGKIRAAVATAGGGKNKQVSTQAYKQLNDVADKLPVGIYTKDDQGNIQIDQEKWEQFLLSEDKPITPTEIKSFIGAIDQLKAMGMPTMGFENSYADMEKLRDNLSQVATTETVKEQTTKQFKDGDIMEKNGIKYKRSTVDGETKWLPV